MIRTRAAGTVSCTMHSQSAWSTPRRLDEQGVRYCHVSSISWEALTKANEHLVSNSHGSHAVGVNGQAQAHVSE